MNNDVPFHGWPINWWLHDRPGTNNIFDTVIVVTDRRVLDAQIRNTIRQFQQVAGVECNIFANLDSLVLMQNNK